MGENYALTEAIYYTLLTLCKPNHGYGIMQKVSELSNGRVKLAAGTLYGAISNLCSKGWIEPYEQGQDSRKKEYIITDIGREVLSNELNRLKELVENGQSIIGGQSDDR